MMWFKTNWFILLLWSGFIFTLLRLYVSGRFVRFFDRANHRSLHHGEVLTGGGFFLFLPLATVLVWQQLPDIALLLLVLTCLGAVDDVKNLSARFRFLVQLVVVISTLVLLDYSLSFWTLFIGLAFLWWLNLFNFMDGANGLVALHAIMTLLTMLWLAVLPNNIQLVVALLVAALVVYLYFNVILKRLFMGDSGSLPLAFMVALIALVALKAEQLSLWQIAVIHAVFITDATLTLAVRLSRQERISEAHRSHLYQRLIAQNKPHWLISVLYTAVTMLCCVVALVMADLTFIQQSGCFIGVYLLLSGVFFHTRDFGR